MAVATACSVSVGRRADVARRVRAALATKVRSHGPATAKPAKRVVGADEPLLGRVLRLFSRPQDGVGQAERNVLVATHELLIGTDITALGAFD
jgi:hypothetical protein